MYLGALFQNAMVYFWVAAIVVFAVIEAAAPGLVSIWFALGSVAALITAVFSGALWLQVTWFFLVSILTLCATRPLAKKYVNARTEPTNADRVIGRTAMVAETIDNIAGKGTVSIEGQIWTARSISGRNIQAGEQVTVQKISGVKLLVD